jgi:hypothetical protein
LKIAGEFYVDDPGCYRTWPDLHICTAAKKAAELAKKRPVKQEVWLASNLPTASPTNAAADFTRDVTTITHMIFTFF